jgi:glutathione-regulated potassium-efflux system ancillary protein KefG
MKNKILILFAHPRLERSQNNVVLVKHIPKIPEITFHDLYEKYPDFNINLEYEKGLLTEHNIIIWQHPFYWYSSPPLLKQWIDIVLEFGWAYGPGGNALQGKIVFNTITTGGPQSAYNSDGHNRFTLTELLAPFDQTAWLCKMTWLAPFVLFGTHRMQGGDLIAGAVNYRDLLLRLAEGDFSTEELKTYKYLNEWISETTITTDKK